MEKEQEFRNIVSEYIAMVSRTSFRILCDRKDSDHVTVRVFVALWRSLRRRNLRIPVRDWLLRRTCLLSRLMITERRARSLAGRYPGLFVLSKPKVDDYDDYVSTQAWELYCRASASMTPVQRIVFTMVSLEGIDAFKVSEISGLSRFRVGIAHRRAVSKIRQELHRFGKDSDYEAYVGFMRKVSDALEDINALESGIYAEI